MKYEIVRCNVSLKYTCKVYHVLGDEIRLMQQAGPFDTISDARQWVLLRRNNQGLEQVMEEYND